MTQGKTYNVSGTDLRDAIEENTRSGHTAGADNNKNGAFDPSRDRHGLGKVVDKFTDKVLDNPIVRTVAQIAQFTPLAPVASVVNTVLRQWMRTIPVPRLARWLKVGILMIS